MIEKWHQGPTEDFGTLAKVVKYMEDNDIPLHAKLEYSGCGSHGLAFRWSEKEAEPFRKTEFDYTTFEK